MGDRANIFVKDEFDSEGRGVFLYTHWGGFRIPLVARDALAKKWRWEDSSYLTRILFDTLTDGDHGEETGYGIGCTIGDNEHPLIAIDTGKRTVTFCHPGKTRPGEPIKSWSFDDYIQSDDDELLAAFEGYFGVPTD